MNMRSILRKLDRGQTLNDEEYRTLVEYLEAMGRKAPQSYYILYNQYAEVLERDYSISLPRHPGGMDDLVNFLVSHPELLLDVRQGNFSMQDFPPYLHPYLNYTFKQPGHYSYLQRLAVWLNEQKVDTLILPEPRRGEVVCVYEDANPHKEIGLKIHFERLGRYSFITRLQSYRYLTRSKARSDRIEVLAPDQLGGIFTNKEKSIYYFIFLSQYDSIKAENAAHLLNTVMHGLSSAQISGGSI